jgi:hypothetical protein
VLVTNGVAVLGAAFVLTWAVETAETDVPRAFALAVIAVVTVAPEYAAMRCTCGRPASIRGHPPRRTPPIWPSQTDNC